MKKPTSIYLVFGEDDYLVEQAAARVLSTIRTLQPQDLEVDTVDYKNRGLGGFIEEISSPSLFSQNKVTILKRFRLTSESKVAKEIEKFVAAGLPEGQFLVLVPDKVDKRLKLPKALARQGGMIECNKLSDEGLSEWINGRFTDEGKTVGPDVVETLMDLKGDDLRAIDSEIEKVVTYAGDATDITREDIEVLVGRSRTERVFELAKFVISRRPDEAFRIVGDLLDANESPIGIVYLLSQEVRRLMMIRLFLEEEGVRWDRSASFGLFRSKTLPQYEAWAASAGISTRDASLNRNPYFLYMRFKEGDDLDLGDLLDLMENLLNANTLLVSSSVSPRVAIERLIAGLGSK
jgi:DNA polymerase-3 subunit delta